MLKFIKSVTTGPYNLIIGIFLGSILTMIAIEFKIFIFTNIGWIISGLSLLYILFYILINKDLLKVEGSVQILEIKFDRSLRCLTITLNNPKTLDGKELFEEIFKTLMLNEEFKKFGNKKIIILSAVLESNKEHNLHSNILVENNTLFEDYYNEISNELDNYNNLIKFE